MPLIGMDTLPLDASLRKNAERLPEYDGPQSSFVAVQKKGGKRRLSRINRRKMTTTPPQSTGELKANRLLANKSQQQPTTITPSAPPSAAKSPASVLLRQLQSDLSPKYTQACRPSPEGRCSRYGRPHKPAEQTDCLDNDIINAVLRKSLSDSGSSAVKRTTTTSPANQQPVSAVKVVEPTQFTGSSIGPIITTSASTSTTVYVSPIEKLLERNRQFSARGSPIVQPTEDDTSMAPSQLIRKSLNFDVETAVKQMVPVRKPLVVVPRVASSGRSPMVAKIVAAGASKPQPPPLPQQQHNHQHVSPRRKKLLPLAPLFSETTTSKATTAPELPVVHAPAPPAIYNDDEFEVHDIEARISSFRVEKSPKSIDDANDTNTDNVQIEQPHSDDLVQEPIEPTLPTILSVSSETTPPLMQVVTNAINPLPAATMMKLDEHTVDDISKQNNLNDYESETVNNSSAIELAKPQISVPATDTKDVVPALPKGPSDRSASVDSGIDSAKGSSIGVGDDPAGGWSVGQLLWARIGSYPFWPSIACVSPDGQLLSTTAIRANRMLTKIHIRFLADNGRRSWVPIKDVVLFDSKADFERMRSELPANLKQTVLRARGFVINSTQMLFWQQAVVEAEMLRTFAVDRRLGVFESTLESERKPSNTNKTSTPRLSLDSKRSSVFDISFGSLLRELERRQRTSTPVSTTSSPATTTPTRDLKSHSNTAPTLPTVEEPTDHKVQFYLRTLCDVDDDTVMATLEGNADFIAFYRNTINNNFGDFDQAHETHLKRLALRKWMLKELRNAPLPTHSGDNVATSVHSGRRSGTCTPSVRALLKPPSSGGRTIDSATPLRRSVRDVRSSTRSSLDGATLALDPEALLYKEQQRQQQLAATAERLAMRAQRAADKERRDMAEMSRYYMREHPKNILFRGMLKEPVCRLCLRPDGQPATPERRGQLRKCRTATCNELVHSACAAQMRAGRTAEQIAELAGGQPSKRKGRKTKKLVLHVTGDHVETSAVDVEEVDAATYDDSAESVRSGGTTTDREPTASTSKSAEMWYDADADEDVYCPDCWPNRTAVCFVCKQPSDGSELRCTDRLCGRHYHEPCLKYWPQNKIASSDRSERQLLCPCHVCHICISDDPRSKHYQIKNSMLIRCVHCPATYHSDSSCVPAGSRLLTASQLICPRHRVETRRPVNANWCFICSLGGELICCETCPTAFHAACLRVALPDRYICEECETGRMPLYGELVWAKIASCRWWPAVTVPPPEVPETVLAVKHRPHDFAIRFFGSYDYSWISRGFVFLYQDGDSECGDAELPHIKSVAGGGAVGSADVSMASSTGSGQKENRPMERVYQKALVQAKEWFERFRALNAAHCNPERERQLKPLPYIKCKANRAIGPVRMREASVDAAQVCECRADDADPCGTTCWNRALQIECDPATCRAGARCQNQRFEARLHPSLSERRMEGKGWGLVTNEAIAAGTFIIEYVGELINRAEFQRRISVKQERKEEHYYFLTLSKELLIDAGPRGNSSRFINHSCEPNCETQVWQVRGNQRVGLFAVDDIEPNTELTFNYNLECIGEMKKICHCGAKRCAGFIGAKYVEPDKSIRKPSKPNAAGGTKKTSSKSKSKRKSVAATQTVATTSSTEASTDVKPLLTALKRRASGELLADDSENNRPEQPSAGIRQSYNSKKRIKIEPIDT